MKALVIDGPASGEIREVDGVRFVVPVPDASGYRKQEYHIHQFQLCGYRIRVASIQMMTDDIDPYHVWYFVVSDKAKEAAVL